MKLVTEIHNSTVYSVGEFNNKRKGTMKKSDNPDFIPVKNTIPHGYSLKPEQIKFLKEMGGSKYLRKLIDEKMSDNFKEKCE